MISIRKGKVSKLFRLRPWYIILTENLRKYGKTVTPVVARYFRARDLHYLKECLHLSSLIFVCFLCFIDHLTKTF